MSPLNTARKPSLRNLPMFCNELRKVFVVKAFPLYPGEVPFEVSKIFFVVSFDLLIHLKTLSHLSNLFGQFKGKPILFSAKKKHIKSYRFESTERSKIVSLFGKASKGVQMSDETNIQIYGIFLSFRQNL